MGLIGIIIFGAVVGLLADLIDRNHDNKWYVDVLLGIVGAVVGGFIRQLLTSNDGGAFHWDVWSFLWALGGTLLVLWGYHAALRATNRTPRV